MKLAILAHDMKTRATQAPGAIIVPKVPLAQGAKLKLKYDAAQCEFRLQGQRVGSAPNEVSEQKRFAAWKRELQTFARDFGASPHARVEYQNGETTYAAVITWSAGVTARDVAEMEGVFSL